MSESTPSGRSSASRRQLVLLAALTAVLAGLVIFVLAPALSGGSAAPPAPAASPGRPAAMPGGQPGRAQRGVVDVHLDRLQAAATDPAEDGRNPFRMGAAPAAPGQASAKPQPGPTTLPPPAAAVPMGPPGPPPAPPIPLKFIGIVVGSGTGKIAVLTDGRNVVSGKEGNVVDGRYRIVKIGEESIQIEHADGRGRQTIRLSGQ